MRLKLSPSSGFCLVAILGVLSMGGWQSWRLQQRPHDQAFEPLVRSTSALPAGSLSCAECHQTVCDHVALASHGTTLQAGTEPWIRERFSGKSFSLGDDGPTVAFHERDQQLWMESDAAPDELRVDWVFGSGRHALTPVSLLVNAQGATELIEGSVSWYPPGVLGLTPGAKGARALGMECLGTHQDHRTAQECFGCHVTQLPMDGGRIQTESMVQGVSCDRCHPDGAAHARAMQQGRPDPVSRWSDLTPLESVNRCGECHRRADQLTPAELSPERTVLVRFASVGLAMSPCFVQQAETPVADRSRRLDCLTCHDPHRPAERSVEIYTAKCLVCHGTEAAQNIGCSSTETAANCLNCHMPKVSVVDKLGLTDHWIRIRTASDPPTLDDAR